MKFLKEYGFLILLLMVAMGIGMAFYARKNREEKEEVIADIREIIHSDQGINGMDLKTVLSKTEPAANYDGLPDAKAIYWARGFLGLWNDDEEAIYAVFANKTKEQIASIYKAFVNQYGKDLDTFLDEFLEDEEFDNVIRIVKQAV